jgi:hypothetical protein
MEKQMISSIIEFLRIADMCVVTGMEAGMACQIGLIITRTPPSFRSGPTADGFIPLITSQHTRAALFLPRDHPVCDLVVKEAIEGYIRSNCRELMITWNGEMQPSQAQVSKNSRLESFLADLVRKESQRSDALEGSISRRDI